MANKILQIDLQNDITPQIGSYDNTGNVTPNNWRNDSGVYSLGPTNTDGRTPYYWFTPTEDITDFDLCWEDYQDRSQTTAQYHLEIGDSAGNVVLSALRSNSNYYIGPVNVGNQAYQTWHKILIEVRKASASSSTVTAYVDGKKVATGTSGTLLTSAKIALLGHVPSVGHWQNAGQRVRYVTIYDRSYTSKGINLDGMMTTITGFVNKLKGALSTVAFSGSYNDLSDKPTISTVNDGTLTIQKNGTNVATFTANQSTAATANIQCVDLSTAQTVAGVKTFSDGLFASKSTTGELAILEDNSINSTNEDANGMPLTGHTNSLKIKGSQVNVIPCMLTGQVFTSGDTSAELRAYKYKDTSRMASFNIRYSYAGNVAQAQFVNCNIITNADGVYNIGSSVAQWNNAYIKSLIINGTAAGDILTHNASEFIPVTGTSALAGSIVPNTDNAYNLGDSTYGFASFYVNKLYLKGSTIFNVVDDNYICVGGATAQANGANIVLNGKDRSTSTGEFKLEARDGTYTRQLIGKPDGTLTWNNKNVAMQEDTVPRAGGAVFENYIYSRSVSDDVLRFTGGTAWANGAGLALFGKDRTSDAGVTFLKADNGTSFNQIALYPSGMFTQNVNGTIKSIAMQEDTVPRSGGAVMTGISIGRTITSSLISIDGGTDYTNGAELVLYGKDSNWANAFRLFTYDSTNTTRYQFQGMGSTLTWNGTAIQYTSDARLKQQISQIDDDLLTAWEDVNPVQFKYNDAVEQKSDNARLHTGYVVQQIDEACKKHNVDISAYGLYCHEEYAEETREVEHEDGTKKTEVIRPANEHYSLRYTEALIVECAYLRKCIKELRNEIEELKSSK